MNNDLFHVSVFDLEACNHPNKEMQVASPIWKKMCSKKAALKYGIELNVFGFGCHGLTSIPLKL